MEKFLTDLLQINPNINIELIKKAYKNFIKPLSLLKTFTLISPFK